MKTASQAVDKAAHAVENVTATLPSPSTMAAPEPEIGSPGRKIPEPAQPLTQLTSLTTTTRPTGKVLNLNLPALNSVQTTSNSNLSPST